MAHFLFTVTCYALIMEVSGGECKLFQLEIIYSFNLREETIIVSIFISGCV